MRIRKHFPLIGVILFFIFVSLFFLHGIISENRVIDNSHYWNEFLFELDNLKYSMKYGTLPFWTPFYYSGRPFMSNPQWFFLSPAFFVYLLIRNQVVSMNIIVFFYFTLSGIAMYLLALELGYKRKSALLAGLVYSLATPNTWWIKTGFIAINAGYSILPLAVLFFHKALHKKSISAAALLGIMLAWQVQAGASLMFIYTSIALSIWGLAELILSKKLRRAILKPSLSNPYLKIVAVSLLSFLFLGAPKLLMATGFIHTTNRVHGVSMAEYIGEDPLKISNSAHYLLLTDPEAAFLGVEKHLAMRGSLGVIAFVLAILGALRFRKRRVLILIIIALASLTLASRNLLTLQLHGLPIIGSTRHISRMLFVYAFAMSLLAAEGFSLLLARMKDKKSNIVTYAIVSLILVELLIIPGFPKTFNLNKEIRGNRVMNYLSNEVNNESFRIDTLDANELIGAFGYSYYSKDGIESVKGGGATWNDDYLMFLAVAKKYNIAKLGGMLNTKYFTSSKPVDIDGLSLVKKFERCLYCERNKRGSIAGPYLYLNNYSLPRVFKAEHAILVEGEGQNAKNLAYQLMLSREFNPSKEILIQDSLDRLTLEEINALDMVVLTEAPSPGEREVIKGMASEGKAVFPDLTKGETKIDRRVLMKKIEELGNGIQEINAMKFRRKGPNEASVDVTKPGWIFISGKYALYPGWKASINNNVIPVRLCDGVVSCVFIERKGTVNLKYMPFGLRKGLWLSALSLVALVGLMVVPTRKHIKRRKANDSD